MPCSTSAGPLAATCSHCTWFRRWCSVGVRAWLGPVAPLKALAAQSRGNPHFRYFSMRRAGRERGRGDEPGRGGAASGPANARHRAAPGNTDRHLCPPGPAPGAGRQPSPAQRHRARRRPPPCAHRDGPLLPAARDSWRMGLRHGFWRLRAEALPSPAGQWGLRRLPSDAVLTLAVHVQVGAVVPEHGLRQPRHPRRCGWREPVSAQPVGAAVPHSSRTKGTRPPFPGHVTLHADSTWC